MADSDYQKQTLALAQELVKVLKAGKRDQADSILAELTTLRDSALYRELGKLTREFHEALNAFRFDEHFVSNTEEQFTDAKDRLGYVITMTEKAAHRTLSAVEAALPLCDFLAEESKAFDKEWHRFMRREMTPQEFRDLSRQLETFFGAACEKMESIKANIGEVVMAQDFQDLTGQIIRRVIALVDDVESNLVELIRFAGGGVAKAAADDPNQLDGPQIPGKESPSALSSQDEVDELLSSLGF